MPKKKKANAILGLLTLKEPSQSALQQFADQQRKQAADKGAKLTQLPATVPKVNSKWNGLPEAHKSKDSDSIKRPTSSTRDSRTPSALNHSTFSVASYGSRNTPSSAASFVSSLSFLSNTTFSSGNDRKDSGPYAQQTDRVNAAPSSPSALSLPELTYFFPDSPDESDLPGSSRELGVINAEDAPYPMVPSSTLPTLSIRSMDKAAESTSTALSPPPMIPSSGLEDLTTDRQSIMDTASVRESLDSMTPELEVFDDEDDDDCSFDDSHDFLLEFQKINTNHMLSPSPTTEGALHPLSGHSFDPVPDSRRLSSMTLQYKQASQLPTLYEASITSSIATDASDDTVSQLPELIRVNSDESNVFSIAPSVTPSVMSASWFASPRERLGLGGRIRKNDILPWESRGAPQPGKRKKNPLSGIFTKNNA
jgi:hypothetical protein